VNTRPERCDEPTDCAPVRTVRVARLTSRRARLVAARRGVRRGSRRLRRARGVAVARRPGRRAGRARDRWRHDRRALQRRAPDRQAARRIDTPESHGGPVECGGPTASRHLERIAPAGSRVRLVADPDSGDTRDRYGRLLAYADARSGDLGQRQVSAGLAYVYRYRGRRFSRLDRYRRAQDGARADGRASWSGCAGDFHSARPGRQP